MKQVGFVILLIICFALILFGIFTYWNSSEGGSSNSLEHALSETEDYEQAEAFIKNGNPKGAIKIIQKYRNSIESNNGMGSQWLDLLIEASMEVPDVAQLIHLYQYNPAAFAKNEKASIMVGEALVITGKKEEFDKLRGMWKEKESLASDWFNLDVDELILEGNRNEAEALLKSKEFPGKEDANRLIKLGLLYANENPNAAWEYLNLANEKDPNNPIVISYRAKLLELIGNDSLALSEYMTAAAIDPENLAMREQLVDFFLHHKKYLQAIELMEESLKNPAATDGLWLKTLFWSRIIKLFDPDLKSISPPEGNYFFVVEYFLNLKPWEFWNQKNYETIPNHEHYINTLQPLWWMRLISALKKNNDEEAAEYLRHNAFKEQSWNPDLTLALKRILNYRANNTLSLKGSSMEISKLEKNSIKQEAKHQIAFFTQLNELAEKESIDPKFTMPKEIDALLKSPLAFTAALLATEWNEAAIDMQTTKIFPADIPPWVVFLYAQALMQNRGEAPAIEFAMMQHKSPAIDLLIGELMLAEQNFEGAIVQLQSLSKLEDSIGMRASWLLSLLYLNQEEYEKAQNIILENKKLYESLQGKEGLARIAVAKGDQQQAEELYTEIGKESPEAKSYFARKAFAEKNWQKAKELTVELLKENPNNPVLKENLLKIQQLEEKQI